MSKRFYLSTRLDRARFAGELLARLKENGWERTFDWEENESTAPEDLSKLAIAQLEGIRDADVVIVLLPGGRGTYTEIGAAIGLGKPIILHAPDGETLNKPYPCAFHHHPSVTSIVSPRLDADAVISAVTALRLITPFPVVSGTKSD